MTVAVLAVLAIVAVNALANRIGVAAPLLLVAAGVGVSLLPFVPSIEVPPEWILMGVLPPLLYSAAVRMPTMDFRRDFASISGLSVLLVVVTALALGVFFSLIIPSVDLALGVALGAIVSPTDAVATAIARRRGLPARTVTLLEGESMLNHATALVLLRTAIAATAGAISWWHVIGDFAYAVALAVVIGGVIGALNLLIRAVLRQATLSTLVSFATPFVAYAPTEHLGASGLVATVVAGLVTGWGGARYLRPQDRTASIENWRTAEVLLEGAVFAVMGLELVALLEAAEQTSTGVQGAVVIGLATIAVLLMLRTGYVTALVARQRHRLTRLDHERIRLEAIRDLMDSTGGTAEPREQRRTSAIHRRLADLAFHRESPLSRRQGVVLVWAGMRGVVTLAAAQTLARDIPDRAALVVIAFVVAAGTLLLQGGTLSWLMGALGLAGSGRHAEQSERHQLRADLHGFARRLLADPEFVGVEEPGVVAKVAGSAYAGLAESTGGDHRRTEDRVRELRLRLVAAQRAELLRKRSVGAFSSASLEWMLHRLDAEQIRLELDR